MSKYQVKLNLTLALDINYLVDADTKQEEKKKFNAIRDTENLAIKSAFEKNTVDKLVKSYIEQGCYTFDLSNSFAEYSEENVEKDEEK